MGLSHLLRFIRDIAYFHGGVVQYLGDNSQQAGCCKLQKEHCKLGPLTYLRALSPLTINPTLYFVIILFIEFRYNGLTCSENVVSLSLMSEVFKVFNLVCYYLHSFLVLLSLF